MRVRPITSARPTSGFSGDLLKDSRLEYFAGFGMRENAPNRICKGQYSRILVQFCIFEDNNSGRKCCYGREKTIFIALPEV